MAVTTPDFDRARAPRAPRAAPKKAAAKSALPFPDHRAPTAADCAEVAEVLTQLHGRVRRPKPNAPPSAEATWTASCGGVNSVLDALVRTILSQNTTNSNSSRAMRGLQARFVGDYAAVCRAPVAEVAASIRCGGLANIKAQRLLAILADLQARHGQLSLEYLRDWTTPAVLAELTRYPGVGPKTAGCVLLFCLQRDVFAVDTHIFRITRALGWVPPHANRVTTQLHLDARVPDQLKHALHVLLIRHGKTCMRCAAQGRPQRPSPIPCPLRLPAPAGRAVPALR